MPCVHEVSATVLLLPTWTRVSSGGYGVGMYGVVPIGLLPTQMMPSTPVPSCGILTLSSRSRVGAFGFEVSSGPRCCHHNWPTDHVWHGGYYKSGFGCGGRTFFRAS